MSDTTELATITPAAPITLTATDIRRNVNLIQSVMKEVMKEGTHFGVIPGCQKPSLYKPGSEIILTTFRIAVEPTVEDLSTSSEARFRVKCAGHLPSGQHVGTGIGECSSNEEKYKWRSAVCNAEWEATDESMRREKFKRDGSRMKQVRMSPADVANTVLKMAKKRAQIDLCLTATAASDCFTQDVQDLPEGMELEQEKPAPIQEPRRASEKPAPAKEPPPAEDLSNAPTDDLGTSIVTSVTRPTKKAGEKGGRKWTRYSFQAQADGRWYSSFDDNIGALILGASKEDVFEVVYEEKNGNCDVVRMTKEN